MLKLVSQIKAALETPNSVPWLPEITDELAGIGWDALGRGIGLTTNNYCTARVISSDSCTPQNIISRISIPPSLGQLKSTICVECLSKKFTRKYCEAGIRFYTHEEINDSEVLNCLEDAIGLLSQVPTIMPTIATLVRTLHLIKVEDDDYDVSFSEPHIPFSIFVSVPRKLMSTDALRVAEAILHEAMHLQLTLIEQVIPLVSSANREYFSPWRGEYRTAQGVLHAIYVFRVIYRFLEQLFPIKDSTSEMTEHIQSRLGEISMQIHEIRSFQDCPDLTVIGTRFVRSLI
jgi:hypothetical protein